MSSVPCWRNTLRRSVGKGRMVSQCLFCLCLSVSLSVSVCLSLPLFLSLPPPSTLFLPLSLPLYHSLSLSLPLSPSPSPSIILFFLHHHLCAAIQKAVREEQWRGAEERIKLEQCVEVARREQSKMADELQQVQRRAERETQRSVQAVTIGKEQVLWDLYLAIACTIHSSLGLWVWPTDHCR